MAMLRSAGASSLTRRPPMEMLAAADVSSPAMMRSSVDLPQPEGPTKTTNSPSFTVEIDVVRIATVPKDLEIVDAQRRHACIATSPPRP